MVEKKDRLLSLDALRGLSVIGMVLVNSIAVYHYGTGKPVYGPLLHAPWAGLTVADLVFPFFIFMVGVSLPFALGGQKEEAGLTGPVLIRLFKRAVLLFLIGLGLTLSFADWDGPIRLLGVLQRIGLTFFGAAILFLTFSWRTLAIIALAVLVGYHGLLLVEVPDATRDLWAPGQNFSSWFDRAMLGDNIYHPTAPIPFEPEGILGTLPSIAQALLGVLTGLYIKTKGGTIDTVGRLALAGTVLTVLGYGLAPFHPIVKAVWSSTFVLATTGLGLLTFAFLIWVIDIKGYRGWSVTFMQAFGINAITAYVLHTYLMGPMLLNRFADHLVDGLGGTIGVPAATLLPAFGVILVTWLPVAIMQRRKIILKV
ncbi:MULTISPECIES: acyltransferase family protein [Kordiimonas]|jgi:predicted acyltransferase|uniref:acyltransferase family protein n=1 Tax=Kordiimonas TaxID=288021 RepID=UPI00257A3D4D|nr:DUF5009 domain-containing protein [Kordiimonas sp. UBA4487]